MTYNKRLLTALLVSLIAFSLIGISNFLLQTKKGTPSFEIILTETNKAILSDNDIVWFNSTSLEMSLNQNGADKIDDLKVPLKGSQFQININGRKIWHGTFMTPISSYSAPPSDVVIETYTQSNLIRLQNGYPSNPQNIIDNRISIALAEHFQSINKLVQ